MAASVYLDTHVVVWLYNNALEKFLPETLLLMDSKPLVISPMAFLELGFLYEIKRLNVSAETIVTSLQQEIGLQICPLNFADVISQAINQTWTRDPFDRIIVAQAAVQQSLLVSKDHIIRQHYANTIWF